MSHLLFQIDVTASMGSWITALNNCLPSIVKAMAMTGVFEKIGIITYMDYDQPVGTICSFSGFVNSVDPLPIQQLQAFAASLRPIGGGGTPEAVKTCMKRMSEILSVVPPDHRVYIIHLTDAPPHTNQSNTLDAEGQKEKKALGQGFDWVTSVNRLLQAHESIRYMCLTTYIHSFYCYLAQRTGGDVIKLQLRGAVSKETVIHQLTDLFNGLLGLDVDKKGDKDKVNRQRFIIRSNVDCYPTEDKLIFQSCSPVDEGSTMIPCPTLCDALSYAVNRMRFDPSFVEHVISEFELVIQTDIMAFTMSPILGKMWREFCKRRSDPRRDDLIGRFQKSKDKLNDKDKQVLSAWLQESYNASAEIHDELQEWMLDNPVVGLLRFQPEQEDLCAQQMVQLLASGSKSSTVLIRAILSRMTLDTTYALPAAATVAGDDPIQLPKKSIPLNIPIPQLFQLVFHTVAPGTKLTRRYAAITACHAIQCGSVLAPLARLYLDSIKGQWINWKRRVVTDVSSVEVPENWSTSFLHLVLHPECRTCLTDQEQADAQLYLQIAMLLRFYHQTEVIVQVINETSIDSRSYADHMVPCPSCATHRPLSLMNESGSCAYCVGVQHQEMESLPDSTITYKQVRCYSCGSIYSRNAAVHIMGHSKCFACRFVNTKEEEEKEASPVYTCLTCRLPFVNWLSLTHPVTQCGGCAANQPCRVLQTNEYPTSVQSVLGTSDFVQLCRQLGFTVLPTFTPNQPLYESVLHIVPSTKDNQDTDEPTYSFTFRDHPVQNGQEIWNQVLDVMRGQQLKLPECSVCLDTVPPSQLMRSCGRKGCEQRVCIPCATAWYTKNTPGTLIYPRATTCQFCARLPTPLLLGRIHRPLIQLTHFIANQNQGLQPDKYYAWCSSCFQADEVGHRACLTEAPLIHNHVCEACLQKVDKVKTAQRSKSVKHCPQPTCQVAIEKTGGCNHIQCSACGTHWCWECGVACESDTATYEHMHTVHGRIYEDEEPDFDSDGWNTDD